MQIRTRRLGTTLVELAVGFALVAGLLGLGMGAYRFFTTRASQTTGKMGRAREAGLLLERLTRWIRFAQRIERTEDGILVLTRHWHNGSWSFLRAWLVVEGDQVILRRDGEPDRRYKISPEAIEFQIEERDGVIRIRFRSSEGDWSQAIKPLEPTRRPILLAPGQSVDDASEETWFLGERRWENADPLPSDPSGPIASDSKGKAPEPEVEGRLSPPARPIRGTLFDEASLLGIERTPEGARFLPARLQPPPPAPDALAIWQRLQAQGLDEDAAALLAATLTGLGSTDRTRRAAALAAALAQLPGQDSQARIALIRSAYPGLPEADETLAPSQIQAPKELLEGARVKVLGGRGDFEGRPDIEGLHGGDAPRPFQVEDLRRMMPNTTFPPEIEARLSPRQDGAVEPIPEWIRGGSVAPPEGIYEGGGTPGGNRGFGADQISMIGIDPGATPPEDPGLVQQFEQDLAERDRLYLAFKQLEAEVAALEARLAQAEGLAGVAIADLERGGGFIPGDSRTEATDGLARANTEMAEWRQEIAQKKQEMVQARRAYLQAQSKLEGTWAASQGALVQPGREDIPPPPVPDSSAAPKVKTLPELAGLEAGALDGVLPADGDIGSLVPNVGMLEKIPGAENIQGLQDLGDLGKLGF